MLNFYFQDCREARFRAQRCELAGFCLGSADERYSCDVQAKSEGEAPAAATKNRNHVQITAESATTVLYGPAGDQACSGLFWYVNLVFLGKIGKYMKYAHQRIGSFFTFLSGYLGFCECDEEV